MEEKIILLDCDGVVVNFIQGVFDELTKLGGPQMSPEEIIKFNFFDLIPEVFRAQVLAAVGSKDFCLNLQPYPGVAEFVEELKQLGQIYITTSPYPSDNWHAERVKWIERELLISKKNVIFTDNKSLVRGDFMIDDRYEYVMDWSIKNPSGRGILLDQPWNQNERGPGNMYRVSSYEEILRTIKNK